MRSETPGVVSHGPRAHAREWVLSLRLRRLRSRLPRPFRPAIHHRSRQRDRRLPAQLDHRRPGLLSEARGRAPEARRIDTCSPLAFVIKDEHPRPVLLPKMHLACALRSPVDCPFHGRATRFGGSALCTGRRCLPPRHPADRTSDAPSPRQPSGFRRTPPHLAWSRTFPPDSPVWVTGFRAPERLSPTGTRCWVFTLRGVLRLRSGSRCASLRS